MTDFWRKHVIFYIKQHYPRNKRPVKKKSITLYLHISISQFGTLFHNACDTNNLIKALWAHMPQVPVLHQPTLLPCLHLFKTRAVLKNLLSTVAQGSYKARQTKDLVTVQRNPKDPAKHLVCSSPCGNRGLQVAWGRTKSRDYFHCLTSLNAKKKHSHWWDAWRENPTSRQKAHADFRRLYWSAKDVFVRTIS